MEPNTDIEKLTHEIKKLNRSFTWHASFARGIAGGFGTAIGASLIVALIAIIFQQLTGLPVLGELFSFLVGSLQ